MGYQLAPSGAATYDAYVNADPGQLTNRNLLHNGAMQVAQRGTSTASITTSGCYTADRWGIVNTTLGTWTQSIESDGPTGSGFAKSLKMLCTTADAAPAAGDVLRLYQLLEGQDVQRIAKGTASAQQLTMSFWVKSNVTGTYIAELRDFDNTRQVSASYTVSASATWERKTITFPADTTGAFDNDNAQSLQVIWWLGAGSSTTSGTLQTTWAASVEANRAVGQTNLAANTNNYWQITGVQLEVGPVATPFEFKSYAQELWECQRYYYRVATGASQIIGSCFYYSTTRLDILVNTPTPMRATPVLDVSSGTDHFIQQPTADAFDTITGVGDADISRTMVYLYVTSGVSGTLGAAGHAKTNNAAAYLGLSADL